MAGVHGVVTLNARKAVELDSEHETDIATVLIPRMEDIIVLEKRRKPRLVFTTNRVWVGILYLIIRP